MPAGWICITGFGMRQMNAGAGIVVASIGLGEDALSQPSDLAPYIAKQLKLIEGRLKEVKCAGPQAIAFDGADEALLLFVRHTMERSGSMLHAQTYVRVGTWLGIITLTTQEAQMRAVRADYGAFVKGLRITPQTSSPSVAR